jgi:acyl-homoserine lactone acylase PvdQ
MFVHEYCKRILKGVILLLRAYQRRIKMLAFFSAWAMGMGTILVAGPSWASDADIPAYRANDFSGGQVLSILPPGENGRVNATDLLTFESSGARPSGNDDQLSMYANLLYGAPSLTDDKLNLFYHEESFGVKPDEIVRVEKPDPNVPVVIYRDKFDIPHIYGATLQAMAFGAGYAAAEDRLFLIDVLRHYGSGTLSSFAGPTCSNEQMDHDELLLASYTDAEKQAQIDALPKKYGKLGSDLVAMGYDYINGINQYIKESRSNPNLIPADYAAIGQLPQYWRPTDIIDIASLIGGIFGRGGGGELANAALLQFLQKKYGPSEGLTLFNDLKEQNDPEAPTTIVDRTFPYEIPGKINPKRVAMPDQAWPLHGGPANTTPGCGSGDAFSPPSLPNVPGLPKLTVSAKADVANLLAFLKEGLKFPKGMSNALLVDAAHSASGHPLAVFGPQVGYFAPQILMLEDLHAPGYDAAGAAFPGINFIVQLGRGRDYAWSATSSTSDNTDQRLERICNPNGGPPDPEGKYYLYQGACIPMKHHTFTETALPRLAGQGAPAVIRHDIYYTVHGIVQGWTTADGGKPVAVVTQRSTFGQEVDSGVGFLQWGMPALTHDARSWMDGAAKIQYTFNWFYIDNKDIAYFSSGLLPIRPPDIDPNLPTWGTGDAEWQGFLPADQHPHEINPPQGFITSWNNKPAPMFSANDYNFGYGLSYRSQLLDRAIRHQFALHHGKITRANLVQAMESAATVDLSADNILPELLPYVGDNANPGVQAMLDLLKQWLADGAHRIKSHPGDSQYDHAAAVAIMDQLYPNLIKAFFDPVFADGGTQTYDGLPSGYSVFPQMEFANNPDYDGQHLGSAYDGGWEGYVMKVLRQLQGETVAEPFSSTLMAKICGPRGEADCRQAVNDALLATYQQLLQVNGGNTDVAAWTNTTATETAKQTMPQYDAIHFRAIGIVGQPAIDWQNRPTFQQVVEFPKHRTR